MLTPYSGRTRTLVVYSLIKSLLCIPLSGWNWNWLFILQHYTVHIASTCIYIQLCFRLHPYYLLSCGCCVKCSCCLTGPCVARVAGWSSCGMGSLTACSPSTSRTCGASCPPSTRQATPGGRSRTAPKSDSLARCVLNY